MKEIGKLLELLNEYEKDSYEKDTNWVYEGEEWEYYEPNNRIIKGNWENEEILTQYELCSKQFGFIKWLVENDKIDFSPIPNKIKEIGIPMKINGEIKYGFDSSDYYWLLMLLAIQDEPIRFLCDILK